MINMNLLTKYFIDRIEKKRITYQQKYKNNIKVLRRLLLISESLLFKLLPNFINTVLTAFISVSASMITIYVGFSKIIPQNHEESFEGIKFGLELIYNIFGIFLALAISSLFILSFIMIDYIAIKEILENSHDKNIIIKNRRKTFAMYKWLHSSYVKKYGFPMKKKQR